MILIKIHVLKWNPSLQMPDSVFTIKLRFTLYYVYKDLMGSCLYIWRLVISLTTKRISSSFNNKQCGGYGLKSDCQYIFGDYKTCLVFKATYALCYEKNKITS